jgi:glycosyltransferase involved in cell wall biosynthesis
LQERLERLGLNVYYFHRPEGHLHPKYLWELLRIIHRHKVQIVHAHNFGSKLWAMLCKLARPGLKLVFTIHDTMMLPRLNRFQILLHRYLIDRHIAISQTVASLCEQRRVMNYTQIYNGIELNRYRLPEKPDLNNRAVNTPFTSEPLRIVYVGRMDYKVKGQDILIQAIHLCKIHGLNVHCTLMGGVYDYNRNAFSELQAMVDELGLHQEVEFLINHTDVPNVLSSKDLFVMPSRFEGLGLVLLEAMTAGLPVIASNTDGPRELVQDGLNGFLFDTGDPEHLFDRIQLVYKNPSLAAHVSKNALDFVRQFDIHMMKERYYRLYELLLRPKAEFIEMPDNPGLVLGA